MSRPRSYLAAAFNARPFGMAVPPNWLGLGAVGLLGAFVNPGFLLIGLGVEVLYLWTLAKNKRFRNLVDATSGGETADWRSGYESLTDRLDDASARRQYEMEEQAADLSEVLSRQGAVASQLGDVRQLVWMHLKLLVARSALLDVTRDAKRDRETLAEQESQLAARVAKTDLPEELRHSLTQQLEVIRSRRQAHADAVGRCELVDAELERLRQQIALVREQALLATDEGAVGRSVDAISASLNEANRWLKDQQELFSGLDNLTSEPPPADILLPKPQPKTRHRRRETE